ELERFKRIPLRGEEHLKDALRRGKGVILWESNAFGSRVLARRALHARGYRIHQLHAANHIGPGFKIRDWHSPEARMKRFFYKWEHEFIEEIIDLPASDSLAYTRTLLNRLQRNLIVCCAGDGRQGKRLIPMPLLGTLHSFAPGMVTLAR